MDKDTLYNLKSSIKSNLINKIEYGEEIDKNKLYSLIDEEIKNLKLVSLANKRKLREMVFNSFRGYDILSDLLEDKTTTEIMINSHKEIFIEKLGKKYKLDDKFESEEQLENIVQQIVGKINRVVNTSSPIVDARLDDGSRVNIVLPPIALKGTTVTIRKFPEPITMKKLEFIDEENT
jgi:pilus assembly protein CpaF